MNAQFFGPVTGADAMAKAEAWKDKIVAEAREIGREVVFATAVAGLLDETTVTVTATWPPRRADRNPFGDDL